MYAKIIECMLLKQNKCTKNRIHVTKNRIHVTKNRKHYFK